MSQHDMVVANDTGAAVRADINNALAALVSNNSGTSAPSTTTANMWWVDTTNSRIKKRNNANTTWVDMGPMDTAWLPASGGVLDQGAADDEIVTLVSSDVSHGMTSLIRTDAYGAMKKSDASGGGLKVAGYTSGTVGMALGAVITTGDTTKAVDSVGAFYVVGTKKSGTGETTLGANENIAVFAAGGNLVRFILDADGDSHQDVGTAWTNFDDHKDVDLLHALSVHVSKHDDPIRGEFKLFLDYNRERLQELRLVQFNNDGHHFINWSRVKMLLVGAVRQEGQKRHWQDLQIQALKETVAELRTQVARLAGPSPAVG